MCDIFLDAIDSDLLKLVHLSNGFHVLNSAHSFKAGNVCHAKACVIRSGVPIIEVNSSFLYCGCFQDYQNMFEVIDKPDYLRMLLLSPANFSCITQQAPTSASTPDTSRDMNSAFREYMNCYGPCLGNRGLSPWEHSHAGC